MDVYTEEFGDLLHPRKPTAYEQFYAKNIRKLVTKYYFLPAELIQCRMQSMWKRFLARNPLLRRKHESEIEATKQLLSKGKSNKTRQRKPGKNAQAGRRPLWTSRKKAECPADSDEGAQGDLFHTPLPGFRRKKKTVEDRYTPLDIQVTTVIPAQTSNRREVVLPDQDSEGSSEGAKMNEKDLPPAGHEVTASSGDSMSEQASDDTGDMQEVGNKRTSSTSKHPTTRHGALTHIGDTTLVQSTENKSKTATATTKTDKADMAKTPGPTSNAHNTACVSLVDIQVNINSLSRLDREKHEDERLQQEQNHKPDLTAGAITGATASQFESLKDSKSCDREIFKPTVKCSEQESLDAFAMPDKKRSVHFLSQTTLSFSSKESENEKDDVETSETSSSTENDWNAVVPMQEKRQSLKSTDLSAKRMHKKVAPIASLSQESSKRVTGYKDKEVTIEMLETLHEHDKSPKEQVHCAQSKARQNMAMRSEANSSTLVVKSPGNIKPRQTAEEVRSTEPHKKNAAKTLSDKMVGQELSMATATAQDVGGQHERASTSSVETTVEVQRKFAHVNDDRPLKSCLKSTDLKSVKSVQPATSDHVGAKSNQEVPVSTSSEHKQGRAAKSKLSLKYLMQLNKNDDKHTQTRDTRDEQLECAQGPNSAFQYNKQPMANIDTSECEENVQNNILICSDEQKKRQTREYAEKNPAATNKKSTRVATIAVAQSKDDVQQGVAKMHKKMPKKQVHRKENSELTAASKGTKSTSDARGVYITSPKARKEKHRSYEVQEKEIDTVKSSGPKDGKSPAERNDTEKNALASFTKPLKDKTNRNDTSQKRKKSDGKPGLTTVVTSSIHMNEIEKEAIIKFVDSEVQRTDSKEVQRDRTSRDARTEAVASTNSAAGRKYAKKNATTATSESPHHMKLRDRKLTSTEKQSMPKAKVALPVTSISGEAAMKYTDDIKAVNKMKNDRLDYSPAKNSGMPVAPEDKTLSTDAFKTPKPVKKPQISCPPTPLKHKVLKKNTLNENGHQNDGAVLPLEEELQGDPETPLGSKTRFTKHTKNDRELDKRFHSQRQSVHHKNNQTMERENEEKEETKPVNAEGQQTNMNGAEHQVLTHSTKFCIEDPKAKKATYVTGAPDNSMKNASRRKAVTFSVQNKNCTNPVLPLNPPEEEKNTMGDEHYGSNEEDIEMSLVRSSNDYRGLTQHYYQEQERQKMARGQVLTKGTQHVTSEMELDEDDLLHLTQRMNQLQSYSLYSQREASGSSGATRTVGSACTREPSGVAALACTKQRAQRSNDEIARTEEHDGEFKRPKAARDTECAHNVIRETQFKASDDEDACSILFDLDDDTETAESGRSQSFFQIKLTPTPLNFLKSPECGNASDSDEELFPWLVDKPEAGTNKRKGKPLPQDVSRDDSTDRPDSKRLCLQQETSSSHFKVLDNSSGYSNYPPLLSRKEAQYFDTGGDENCHGDSDD